jgi:tetratricopeptide (TPR) repeat protein
MEENTGYNPLQPVFELIQGGDPDRICLKYGISRGQLDKMLTGYQMSRREAALTDAFTISQTKRNDPCPCGSGKKYKKCCLPRHEEARKLVPQDQLVEMEKNAKAREKVEKDVKKGFGLIFSGEYERAEQFAQKMLQTFPEDDRFHDLLVNAHLSLGNFDEAFRVARKRWQTATEEKLFYQENGFHKREGVERNQHVHFYSPSTWLEKFWISQRARTWRDTYPAAANSDVATVAGKLREANDLKRFPAKEEGGFETRKEALAPVLARLESTGPQAIPFLLPLTYSYSWASLFVPDLLHAWGTDECIRLLAELSMFRFPYFSQKCLSCLENCGERAIPVISKVLKENPAFEELTVGLLTVLGNLPCPESFEILAGFTGHENRYIVNWACEALSRHKNPAAAPYLERAKEQVGSLSKIAGAIKAIGELKKENPV